MNNVEQSIIQNMYSYPYFYSNALNRLEELLKQEFDKGGENKLLLLLN